MENLGYLPPAFSFPARTTLIDDDVDDVYATVRIRCSLNSCQKSMNQRYGLPWLSNAAEPSQEAEPLELSPQEANMFHKGLTLVSSWHYEKCAFRTWKVLWLQDEESITVIPNTLQSIKSDFFKFAHFVIGYRTAALEDVL